MEERQRLSVTLLTGRTIEQGVGKEQGKNSKEYGDSVSVCYVDPEDLKKLGTKEGSNVLVSTKHGTVVVRVLKSLRTPHVGMIFIPYGPWANVIVDPETDSIGMPSLKGIPAEVEPAPDEPVVSLNQLLKEQFGKQQETPWAMPQKLV
jgi:formylmethanofuran dehydrogenase subunit D